MIEAWRKLVDAGLRGRDFSQLQSRTRDGIVLDPLYPPARNAVPLPGRAGAWRIVQVIDHPDPDRANQQALADLQGGAGGIALRFAPDADASAGLPATREALHVALEGIDLVDLHIRLEPFAQISETATWLADLVVRSGIAEERARVAFGLDVISGVATGATEQMDRRVECFARLWEAGFSGPLADLDARPVHETGGSEAQELAAILASATWWLRALEAGGIDAAGTVSGFGASMSVDRDQWLSVAKLRALRLLWARLLELCGVAHRHLPIHAETSRRMMTRSDPHTNIIRTTIAALAAGIGGADSIAVLPFTAALDDHNDHARTLARNAQHLLLAEAQLHDVADPAAGAGATEALTMSLAEAAWGEFQTIEQEGGLAASLEAGAFQARIAGLREALRAELAAGKAPLVGSTVYRPADAGMAAPDNQPSLVLPTSLAPVRLEELAGGLAS